MSEINKLTNISVNKLEAAIAKAISELAEVGYNCSISTITYDPFGGAKFDVSLSLPMNFSITKDNKDQKAD